MGIHLREWTEYGFEIKKGLGKASALPNPLFLLHTPLLYNHTSHHLIFKHHLPPSDFIRGNPSSIQPTDIPSFKMLFQANIQESKKHLHNNILYINIPFSYKDIQSKVFLYYLTNRSVHIDLQKIKGIHYHLKRNKYK